jgi:hypothetical protein
MRTGTGRARAEPDDLSAGTCAIGLIISRPESAICRT